MRNLFLGALVGAIAALSACANRPEPRESQFPILGAERSDDGALGCAQILDQVQSAAALHREIGREEARFVGDDLANGGLGMLFDPVSGLASAAVIGTNADVRGKRYQVAREASQRRLVVLLGLAHNAGCTNPPTDSLAKLDAIRAMPEAQPRDMRAKRTALWAFFDGLALTPAQQP